MVDGPISRSEGTNTFYVKKRMRRLNCTLVAVSLVKNWKFVMMGKKSFNQSQYLNEERSLLDVTLWGKASFVVLNSR